MRAVDIMETDILSNRLYLTRNEDYRHLATLLKDNRFTHYAVVESDGILDYL